MKFKMIIVRTDFKEKNIAKILKKEFQTESKS